MFYLLFLECKHLSFSNYIRKRELKKIILGFSFSLLLILLGYWFFKVTYAFGNCEVLKKVVFPSWIGAFGKILTIDNLVERNMVLVHWCCMLTATGESVDNLLLHCPNVFLVFWVALGDAVKGNWCLILLDRYAWKAL